MSTRMRMSHLMPEYEWGEEMLDLLRNIAVNQEQIDAIGEKRDRLCSGTFEERLKTLTELCVRLRTIRGERFDYLKPRVMN